MWYRVREAWGLPYWIHALPLSIWVQACFCAFINLCWLKEQHSHKAWTSSPHWTQDKNRPNICGKCTGHGASSQHHTVTLSHPLEDMRRHQYYEFISCNSCFGAVLDENSNMFGAIYYGPQLWIEIDQLTYSRYVVQALVTVCGWVNG